MVRCQLQKYGMNSVVMEIKKCRVLCAAHHKIHTYGQLNKYGLYDEYI